MPDTCVGRSSSTHDEDFSESIMIFRKAFQRLMNPEFLSNCCEDLQFIFEDSKGMELKRNPSPGDILQVDHGEDNATFRISRAVYRSAVVLEKEWYQLKGEQIGGRSSNENVISYFFNENPGSFELTLVREGRLVYIRLEGPEKLLSRKVKNEICEKILE